MDLHLYRLDMSLRARPGTLTSRFVTWVFLCTLSACEFRLSTVRRYLIVTQLRYLDYFLESWLVAICFAVRERTGASQLARCSSF